MVHDEAGRIGGGGRFGTPGPPRARDRTRCAAQLRKWPSRRALVLSDAPSRAEITSGGEGRDPLRASRRPTEIPYAADSPKLPVLCCCGAVLLIVIGISVIHHCHLDFEFVCVCVCVCPSLLHSVAGARSGAEEDWSEAAPVSQNVECHSTESGWLG